MTELPELTSRMEAFSKAYVRAVVAAAGFVISPPETDTDSIDLTIQARRELAFPIRPKIDLQLKSTSTIDEVGELIPYALKVKNYNELRETTMVPRLLVLVLLPRDAAEWAAHDASGLLLRRCGYWLSLEGAPATDNEHSSTVQIPSRNLFGPEQLRQLMADIQKRYTL